MPRKTNELWETAADDVISVMIREPEAWSKALFDYGVAESDLPPGPYADVWRAIVALRSKDTDGVTQKLSHVDIAERVDSADIPWIAKRDGLYSKHTHDNFAKHCRRLRNFGTAARLLTATVSEAKEIRTAIATGAPIDETRARLASALSETDNARAIDKGASLESILDDVAVEMDTEATPGIDSGVRPVSSMLRGLSRGMFIVWVAPYKSRKTSVALQIMISTARQKLHVIFASLDEDKRMITYKILAWFMAEWFFINKLWDVADEKTGIALNTFDGDSIAKARKNRYLWHSIQNKAYEYAMAQARAIAPYFRIYDQTTSDNFGSPADVERAIKHDNAVYGPTFLVVVDNIQKMTPEGQENDYRLVKRVAGELDRIKTRQNVCMWALSQQNEETIKASSSNGPSDGYSVGATGGGAISSNAAAVFVSRYKMPDQPRPDQLFIQLKHARYLPSPKSETIYIHPPSGYMPPIARPDDLPSVRGNGHRVADPVGQPDDNAPDPDLAPW